MKQPNIFIFMTDQQRGDTAPPYGRAHMPFLEKVAQEGVSLAQTYCPSPHCCPSRASFFSGLYPSEHGVWNNVNVGNTLSRGLYDGVRLWSEDLKEAGYDLTFSGKWHISDVESPQHRGWETTSYIPAHKTAHPLSQHQKPHQKDWIPYTNPPQKGAHVISKGYIDRPGYPNYSLFGEDDSPVTDSKIVHEAVEVILNRKHFERPWCQYVGVLGPHDPYYVPKEFLDLYDLDTIELPVNFQDKMEDKPGLYRKNRDRFDQLSDLEQRECLRHYLALCSYQDSLFGQLLKALQEKGNLEDTVVIYLSDHGDYAAEHGLWTKGLPCFRGAYHVPLVIRWPEKIKNPGSVIDEFVSLTDIAPTILEMAGIAPQSLSGKSLMPFLKGEALSDWREAIYTQSNGNEIYGIQRSITTRKWKFVYNTFDYDELYNLENDPDEMHNLAWDDQYQEVLRELSLKIWDFAREHGDVCVNPYIFTGLANFGPGIVFE